LSELQHLKMALSKQEQENLQLKMELQMMKNQKPQQPNFYNENNNNHMNQNPHDNSKYQNNQNNGHFIEQDYLGFSNYVPSHTFNDPNLKSLGIVDSNMNNSQNMNTTYHYFEAHDQVKQVEDFFNHFDLSDNSHPHNNENHTDQSSVNTSIQNHSLHSLSPPFSPERESSEQLVDLFNKTLSSPYH
jgi:hypothetical protein